MHTASGNLNLISTRLLITQYILCLVNDNTQGQLSSADPNGVYQTNEISSLPKIFPGFGNKKL